MKGKILDLNSFEAFISLEDDSILIVPLSNLNTSASVGSYIDVTSLYGSYRFSSNHRTEMTQDKLIDFF